MPTMSWACHWRFFREGDNAGLALKPRDISCEVAAKLSGTGK